MFLSPVRVSCRGMSLSVAMTRWGRWGFFLSVAMFVWSGLVWYVVWSSSLVLLVVSMLFAVSRAMFSRRVLRRVLVSVT